MTIYFCLVFSLCFLVRSYYSFFYFCFLSVIVFISSISSNLNNSFFFINIINDESSLLMGYMTLFVMFISFFFGMSSSLNIAFVLMLLFTINFFHSSSLFLLYFFYECSLVPILYIIITWGSYPERSLSSFMLLIYTAFFSFPFMFVIFYYWFLFNSFMFFSFLYSPTISLSLVLTFLSFLAFCVKLPVYGLHFWLPMAHVEAPTFGSIVLAGILLKLGGVGLIRLSSYSLIFANTLLFSASYFFIFLVFVTIICCYQSDFKRLVAYSSVSHIMAIPILILSNFSISHKAILLLIFFHGLSSPVLFILVNIIYVIFSTRQLLLTRGILVLSPLLTFFMLYAFFFTISAPPLPSYVSEVFFFASSLSITLYAAPFLFMFAFLGLVYNLSWLSSIIFSTPSFSPSFSSSFIFSSFLYPICLSLLLSFFILFLCSFV